MACVASGSCGHHSLSTTQTRRCLPFPTFYLEAYIGRMLFEISGDDIARLGDEDLRTLVGRLCEAELSRKGFSKAAVTYGGNQTASDGGIDVRVQIDPQVAMDGFIPRWSAGLQSKISDMRPKAIRVEMRPGGALRPVIAELAEHGGAYIIVSSNGSVADPRSSAAKTR